MAGLVMACQLRLHKTPPDVVVLDDRPWLSAWRHQFWAQDIDVLRSGGAQHPHPDPDALRRWAAVEGRDDELVAAPLFRQPPDYFRPGARLMVDFCDAVIKMLHLTERRVDQRAVRLVAGATGRWGLQRDDGAIAWPGAIVLAHNPAYPRIPDWAQAAADSAPPGTLLHSTSFALPSVDLRGRRILVIGGGQTAGQIAVGAAYRGAHVVVAARHDLWTAPFDFDSRWLTAQATDDFLAESPERRRELLDSGRHGGGTMDSDLRRQMLLYGDGNGSYALSSRGSISVLERRTVDGAAWRDGHWNVGIRGESIQTDLIVLCSGTAVDIEHDPLTGPLRERHPTSIHGGLPLLADSCRWPGTNVFVMGEIAGLSLGPIARSIAGARAAAARVTDTIALKSRPRHLSPHCPPSLV